jgi:tetratricopeptide (TPR) repeat protein
MGMSEAECDELINFTAKSLGITSLITKEYKNLLYKESDGHPYVVKVFLGDIAKENKLITPKRIIASKDEILDALFERTFSKLSPVAKRTFLTLCNWRSTIPQLAVEAVLLRPENEIMDVDGAIEELRRCSFIEVTNSNEDNTPFLSVPLAASMFGEKKLGVSPLRSRIESDTALLQAFGSGQRSDIRHGLSPRVEKLFHYVAVRIGKGPENLDDYLPMLEFVARKHPKSWLILATLHEETGNLEKSKEALTRYLEVAPKDPLSLDAWQKLADACRNTQDVSGELHALAAICELTIAPFSLISSAANRANATLTSPYAVIDNDEKRIVLGRMIEGMESRINEANATDYSRLAWLCLRLKDEARAKKYCKRGLEKDPSNEYCQNLANRLGIA